MEVFVMNNFTSLKDFVNEYIDKDEYRIEKIYTRVDGYCKFDGPYHVIVIVSRKDDRSLVDYYRVFDNELELASELLKEKVTLLNIIDPCHFGPLDVFMETFYRRVMRYKNDKTVIKNTSYRKKYIDELKDIFQDLSDYFVLVMREYYQTEEPEYLFMSSYSFAISFLLDKFLNVQSCDFIRKMIKHRNRDIRQNPAEFFYDNIEFIENNDIYHMFLLVFFDSEAIDLPWTDREKMKKERGIAND